MERKPNVVLIVCDDLGYSDLGCYGGEIETPNIDKLADAGVRFSQFYSSPRCAPSRASLLTGLHPHQTGIGILTYDDGPEGYPGNLNRQCVTIAEVLRNHGYRNYLCGKWHLARNTSEANDTWPLQRGFDRFFGTLVGSGSFFYPNTLTRDNQSADHEAHRDNFYYTDAITDETVRFIAEHCSEHPDTPFFQYVAYTAPHWPLHAPEQDIAKYKGRFDKGWDQLRQERLERLKKLGMVKPNAMAERDPAVPAWDEAEDKAWYLRCMEVYAAQLDHLDQGVGKIVDTLKQTEQYENTIIIFLSDNGGCAEVIKPHPEPGVNLLPRTHTRNGEPIMLGNHKDIMPGSERTFQTYSYWANLSNTPFRLYKSWTHEGGIATPLIIQWPNHVHEMGSIRYTLGQLPDIMATILEVTGASYPTEYQGNEILPAEGKSLASVLAGDHAEERTLFWEHQGNAAIRHGKWKLVRQYPGDWELYDMETDRTEIVNLAQQLQSITKYLSEKYEVWASRCCVIPREKILSIPGRRTIPNPYFGWMI